MIHFTFTVKLLEGNAQEWASHDNEIRRIVSQHGGWDHRMEYSENGMARTISVYYDTLDDIHNAGVDIRMFFKDIGIKQTVVEMKQNRITANQSLIEVREALTC